VSIGLCMVEIISPATTTRFVHYFALISHVSCIGVPQDCTSEAGAALMDHLRQTAATMASGASVGKIVLVECSDISYLSMDVQVRTP